LEHREEVSRGGFFDEQLTKFCWLVWFDDITDMNMSKDHLRESETERHVVRRRTLLELRQESISREMREGVIKSSLSMPPQLAESHEPLRREG
jgi:hypothetical protein